MSSKIVARALELGMIDESEAKKITPEQVSALQFLTEIVENGTHDHEATDEDVALMREEIEKLNDMIDLEDCDRVEKSKSFSREGAEVSIPTSLAPFMIRVILPALRKIVEAGP